MNNDINRNTRTLIVSFVVAIMALIPMRFLEVGQMTQYNQPQVLGESVKASPKIDEGELLEAPYNRIEKVPCLESTEATQIIRALENRVNQGELSASEVKQVLGQIDEVNSLICK